MQSFTQYLYESSEDLINEEDDPINTDKAKEYNNYPGVKIGTVFFNEPFQQYYQTIGRSESRVTVKQLHRLSPDDVEEGADLYKLDNFETDKACMPVFSTRQDGTITAKLRGDEDKPYLMLDRPSGQIRTGASSEQKLHKKYTLEFHK